MLAGPPTESINVPIAVRRIIANRAFEVVWLNQLGGMTFRVGGPVADLYVKWTPTASGVDLSAEIERLSWASAFVVVPKVLDAGEDSDGSWFCSVALAGENAITSRWKRNPEIATRAVGVGLRVMHQALPINDCPFEWRAQQRVRDVERRAAQGLTDDFEWSDDFAGMQISEALRELRATPAEDLVVCHGDACAPNTLLDHDGHFSGHVDMGTLGVGDRWADLAVASWSTVWNYGPGWEGNLFDAYGIDPDVEKIRYYRLLWELG